MTGATRTDGAPHASVPAPGLVLGAALVALVTAHLFRGSVAVGDATYLLVVVGAALVAAAGLRLRPDRRGWTAITLGVAASAAGDVLHYAYTWTGGEPGLSWCDPFWLASYGLLIVGAARLVGRGRRDLGVDADALIDVAAAAVITGYAAWEIFVRPALDDSSVAFAARVAAAAYPVLDAVLLTLLGRVVLSRATAAVGVRVLAAGIGCWLVADYAAMVALQVELSRDGRFMNAGWMVGAGLLAAAVVWGERAPVEDPEPEPSARRWIRPRQLAWTVVPLFIPAVVNAVVHLRGGEPDSLMLVVVTALLVLLVLVRAGRLVRARNEALSQLEGNERFYRTLAAASSDAVVVVDSDFQVVHDSPMLHELLDHPRCDDGWCDAVGTDVVELIGPVDSAALRDLLARSLDLPGVVLSAEVELASDRAGVVSLDVRIVNLLDDPSAAGVVVTLHDATERRASAAELSRQAFHDPLTGLANRALFRDRLEQALRRSARTGADPAVAFLDLDGFKMVNDSLGHEAGDVLLITLGERIRAAVRPEDTVARLGGDEFALLLEGSRDPVADATAAADRVLAALVEPVELAGRSIALSASIGVAVADPKTDASAVLRNADIAMYRAKGSGKGRWVVFDPTMRAMALERLELELDLGAALAQGQLRLAYQPVVDLWSGEIVGFEALLRWHHPTLGLLPPDAFIPIAEGSGLIVEIGGWVLREACATAADWQRRFPRPVPLSMAVNVSGVQVAHPGLVAQVGAALDASGLRSGDLVVEMTETALISDPASAARRLSELRDLGVRIAIDDFGTGYSSLGYLRQFDVDILKIDRSFVSGISEQPELPPLIRGLLDLGRTLGLEVIAEGIEDGLQLERLQDAGCPFGQGYLFSRPLTAPDAAEMLAGLTRLGGLDDDPVGIPEASPVVSPVRRGVEQSGSSSGS